MLKWTVTGQRGVATASWRQTAVADESPTCFPEKPRRRRPSRASGRYDKENTSCADVHTPTGTTKTCRRRRRESLRDVSNHNSPAAAVQSMSPGGRRTKSPCTETHWMPVQKRRSGDNVWTDEKVKRKKPCTGVHSICTAAAAAAAVASCATSDVTAATSPVCTAATSAVCTAATSAVCTAATTSTSATTSAAATTNAAATTSAAATASATAAAVADAARRPSDGHLCVSMSPTEEPVQLLHKRLPVPPTGRSRRPDDLLASRLIDRFVDQIRMDDATLLHGGGRGCDGVAGDRMSIVSPLAKRLADIRLRRSPSTVSAVVAAAARKRKRAWSSGGGTSSSSSSSDDDDDFSSRWPRTPPAGRRRPWWWRCSNGGGGGHTLPSDGLPSPFHSSRPARQRRRHRPLPHSPITPLRAALDDSDDCHWDDTPSGRPRHAAAAAAAAVRYSAPSTASSRTVDDDVTCGSDPRSPAVLDETFAIKSRRCLSFASPPPSGSPAAKKRNPRQKTSRRAAATPDKASGLEVCIDLKDLTHLTVLLKRGRNLMCADGEPPNAYIKVYLVPGKGTCHKTRVRHHSANPRFDESFSVPLTEEDHDKRILISAWHRDRSKRRSEFLGYMSFAVKNVLKKEINGTFKLVPQSPGRMPPHSTPAHRPQDLTVVKTVISTDEEEEEIMIDDEPTPTNYSESAKVKSNQKPKKDVLTTKTTTGNEENKFLQYLELDPPLSSRDGKNGRTPFTVTKRLSKPSGSSFGFSIAWTHPPRVERVECGLPADQADLKPGDYVVFINKTNVVMMAEDDVMELIKSCGNQLSLEVYNKTSTASRRNQPPPRSASTPGVLSLAAAAVTQSDTTVSLQEPPRRRFHIPQVTFTSENLADMDSQLRWIHQLLTAEQQFVLCLQFGIGRYLLPLAERKDVLKSKEHAALFQNVQELLRTTEDTLERIIDDDWKMLARNTCKVYVKKIDQINAAYYKYCKGIIHADCVLVDKIRNSHFLDLIKDPPIPDRRPDLITFLHKPLEHYRNVLKCMQLIQINTEHDNDDFEALSHIVHEMQATYRFITLESGLMEPEVEGKPLLSLNDLEARLVFTRCKPFTLNVADRHWIFAGDLSRVEGRSVRSYWALLFSDILLFTKVSRDRVLFVTDEPLPLSSIAQTQFSVKKKDTEFRLIINSGSDAAPSSCHSSPAMTGCSPLLADLSGTLSRLPKNKGRVIVLRAPKPELKAVWQNLIQRQILTLDKNAFALDGKFGEPSSDPPDSPDDLLANSLATLDDEVYADRLKSFAESLVDERCQRMSKSSACNKGKALHISQWIKGELGGRYRRDDDGDKDEEEEEELELWTAERMHAKQAEIQRRLSSAARDVGGGDVVIEMGTDTGSVVSSPGDSQRTVVPENVCQKCQRTCDINGNQQSDAFLDMDPGNKWKPSTVSVSGDLSPCEPFGDNHNNNNNNNNNNNHSNHNNHGHTNINMNDDDDEDDDDDDGLELERPYAVLASSPPQQQRLHHLQHHQQPTRFSSTTSLDRHGTNRDRSTDSLDRVEFCSTTDYRWPEDYCPVTASCCLPTDEDYDYDASSEEFWGTPNSSTTSPLSVEVNYNEERQNEPTFAPAVTCGTPKKRPARLEPLIEEIESSDNTPSYEFKEIVYGEGQTLLNFKSNGTASASKDKHSVDKSSTTKNLFNMLWRTSRSRSKRTCSGESKLGASFIRRRRSKSEKSKQNKEIKLNLIESVYLLLFG